MTGFVTVIFVAALALLFRYSLAVVTDEAVERNMQILEGAALEVDHVLHQTEITARAASWMVRQYLDTPDSIPALCQQVQHANPWIERCYVVNDEAGKAERELRNENGPDNWYCQALDIPADSVPIQPLTLSYRLPVLDSRERPVATLVVDVRIDWPKYASAITDRMPSARCYLQGEGGCCKMDASGYMLKEPDGEDLYVFYRPFSNQRWGLAFSCPENKILGAYYRLQTIALIAMAIVLLLLLFICRKVIDRNLKSLDRLSDTVRHLSENRFDKPIPYHGRHDEIGELQRSFSLMQKALAEHIREMHQKNETLTQRNAKLQEAYERGQEDERAKALILGNVTGQFLPPVQAISAATSQLSMHYQDFAKQEMTSLKTEITAQSETITTLSDQMLKI